MVGLVLIRSCIRHDSAYKRIKYSKLVDLTLRPLLFRLNPNLWLSLYPVLFAGFDMEVMRKNIVHCVHRALQPSPSPGQTPNGQYAEKFSPISRVQNFQRHQEKGYPVEPEDATLKPHLQQERSAKFEDLQYDNRIEHL